MSKLLDLGCVGMWLLRLENAATSLALAMAVWRPMNVHREPVGAASIWHTGRTTSAKPCASRRETNALRSASCAVAMSGFRPPAEQRASLNAPILALRNERSNSWQGSTSRARRTFQEKELRRSAAELVLRSAKSHGRYWVVQAEL